MPTLPNAAFAAGPLRLCGIWLSAPLLLPPFNTRQGPAFATHALVELSPALLGWLVHRSAPSLLCQVHQAVVPRHGFLELWTDGHPLCAVTAYAVVDTDRRTLSAGEVRGAFANNYVAEIEAIVMAVHCAVSSVCIYTDCNAAVQVWQSRRMSQTVPSHAAAADLWTLFWEIVHHKQADQAFSVELRWTPARQDLTQLRGRALHHLCAMMRLIGRQKLLPQACRGFPCVSWTPCSMRLGGGSGGFSSCTSCCLSAARFMRPRRSTRGLASATLLRGNRLRARSRRPSGSPGIRLLGGAMLQGSGPPCVISLRRPNGGSVIRSPSPRASSSSTPLSAGCAHAGACYGGCGPGQVGPQGSWGDPWAVR